MKIFVSEVNNDLQHQHLQKLKAAALQSHTERFMYDDFTLCERPVCGARDPLVILTLTVINS